MLTPAAAQLSADSCFQILHIAGQFFPGKVTRFYFYAQSVAQAASVLELLALCPDILSPMLVTHLVSRLYQAQSSFSTQMSRLDDISFTA